MSYVNKESIMRKLICSLFFLILTGLGLDVGKHWYLKRFLESQMNHESARVKADQITLKIRPFATKIHFEGLTLKSNHNTFYLKQAEIHQKITQLRAAELSGRDLLLTDYVKVDQVQGTLFIHHQNQELVFEGDPFSFSNVRTDLPNIQLRSKEIGLTWHYFTKSREIDFGFDAPNFEVEENETINLHGAGRMNLVDKPKGNIDLRVSGIDRLTEVLVKNKIIGKTQAQLIMLGGQLFGGKEGEVPLPLRFEEGKFYLGPVEIG
jgi:hypothetical protein